MEKSKTRKPHSKSRNGCLPCKARHVKCDETKPECVNCDKYGSKCEYPPIKVRKSKSSHVSPYGVVSTPSSADGTSLHQSPTLPATNGSHDPVLHLSQLRLYHHFVLETINDLGVSTEIDENRNYMMKIAFDFPFLLHGCLALAALHLSRIEPALQAEYIHQAESYHNAGLAQFRTEIQDIVDSNFEAVFCFAFLMFPYACAVPILIANNSAEQALDSILQNFHLTRAVRPMVVQYYTEMRDSGLGRFVPPDVRNIDWKRDSTTELVALRKFAEVTANLYPQEINEAYSSAIRALDVLFSAVARSPNVPSPSLLKMWPHEVTPRFLELLSEKQPGALIIFAHYAVLLRKSQKYWFLQGLAELILDISEKLVPTEWTSWLDWPREQIRPGSADAGAS